MNRFGKFSLVGTMGSAIQFGALALFNRWMPGHYLCATAAAIELTLAHNFLWHSRYTWNDRAHTAPVDSVVGQVVNLRPIGNRPSPSAGQRQAGCQPAAGCHPARSGNVRRFLRFHVSSGLISMLGNLVLMRLLVGEAHLPVLVSNVTAVVSCSIPNFLLGHNWVFAGDAS